MPGEGPLHLGHLLRRTLGHDLAAADAAAGAEVEYVVGSLDDPRLRGDRLQIVLDQHHGIALVHQPVQHFEELADILEMETRGRLVRNGERLAGAAPIASAQPKSCGMRLSTFFTATAQE